MCIIKSWTAAIVIGLIRHVKRPVRPQPAGHCSGMPPLMYAWCELGPPMQQSRLPDAGWGPHMLWKRAEAHKRLSVHCAVELRQPCGDRNLVTTAAVLTTQTGPGCCLWAPVSRVLRNLKTLNALCTGAAATADRGDQGAGGQLRPQRRARHGHV